MKITVTNFDERRTPDLHSQQTIVLSEGKLSRKTFTRLVPRDRHTGRPHHENLKVETWRKRKTACEVDEARTVTLQGDEVQTLLDFVVGARSLPASGRVGTYIEDVSPDDSVRAVVGASEYVLGLPEVDRDEVLLALLRQAADRPDVLRAVLEHSAADRDFLARAASALNLAVYEAAVADLERLVAADAAESAFQSLLAANPWMFGSEYARLLSNRTVTVRQQQDFLLTRTADDRLELIEIKTALGGDPLFAHDKAHDVFHQKADLTKVIAQVQNYLADLDGTRDLVLRKFMIDAYKATARIVIGRDGDKAQMEALKRTNAHLHRIEIITFDGLVRIARRVLAHLGGRDDPSASAS